ncbi:MAG: PQQ-binding-like beta-propeller repeat protein, partial [Verrucomicrobiae bacterium]|nr:PQQ-binding-like beta-propeller repeat protein [Verrucomicrobiae bacterium]
MELKGEDWPTYLRDNHRVGATSESLGLPLSARWSIAAPTIPRSAWPGPDGRTMEGHRLRDRNTYDDAFHVAVVKGRLYFGSSVDDQMRCIDLETGKLLWTFLTEGPIRLAPTVFQERVYFGADDGLVYCVGAADGQLIWKLRPGPVDERLIGRDEMVSRWPIRTGVTIQEDKTHGAVAYFGAGVFPHENVYLCGVRAEDGKILWKVDNLSEMNAERNDLSPQGYLLTDEQLLVVPSGRSLPAVFDRATGEFLHKKTHAWRSTAGGVIGSTQALLSDGQIYAWGADHVLAMDVATGDVGYGWFAGRQLTVAGDAAYAADGVHLVKLDRQAYAVNSRKRHQLEMDIKALETKAKAPGPEGEKAKADIQEKRREMTSIAEVGVVWKIETPNEARLVVAGSMLFAGGEGNVTAYDTESGKEVWRAEVSGTARGLAVADGRLIASTDTGDVVCFGPGSAEKPKAIRFGEPLADRAWKLPADEAAERVEAGAKQILATTGIREGYCLVLGSEDGRLAVELARGSDLDIHCIEPDATKATSLKQTLAGLGLYGTRVHVTQAPFDAIPLPD